MNKKLNIKSKIPPHIIKLAKLFSSNNFKLYLVGGAIRDYYLGKIPSDFDFATSALVDEMLDLLKDYKIFDIGKKYGTIGIRFHSNTCEITTFRSDGLYLDSRHPSNVAFTSNIMSDLARRDFSINAMAYNLQSGELIDLFNGIKDIESKQICCVGNAKTRFKEDALRILRAFSFSSRLNFRLEEQTLRAAIESKDLLENISRERIKMEMLKILQGSNSIEVLKILKKHDILHITSIPKKLNKIPRDCRIFIGFYVFRDFMLTKEMRIIQNIFMRLKLYKKVSKRMELFAKLSSEFSMRHILIAMQIKKHTSKKYRLLKKGFNARRLGRNLAINGFDILALSINKNEIRNIKEDLLLKIRTKQLINSKKILKKYIKEYF